MHNPTLMERQMARSNGGGIGAKSYAQRMVGNGLEVDVQEVQPGHYRATVNADGGLAHKVFGEHFQADVARMGDRHYKGRLSTQAPAIRGAGARTRGRKVRGRKTSRRALPPSTRVEEDPWSKCYNICKQTSNPGLCIEVNCDKWIPRSAGGRGVTREDCPEGYKRVGGICLKVPSVRRRGGRRVTGGHVDAMKAHLESAKQSRGMGYGRSAPFSSYLPGVKDYWVYPDEPWADSVGPYAHYPNRPPFNVQYRGNKGMGNPETAGVFGPIAGRWPSMNRSVVGRGGVGKAAARATSRKTSTVAQQLQQRGR